MALKKQKPAAKTAKKPAAAKKKAAPAKTAKPAKKEKAASVDFSALDRKALASKARELKKELLSIRFNIQSPNLTEYRKKRKELAKVLGVLA